MNIADYINLGMGLLLFVSAWLCYRFPNLINPYGGMSPERKALVDIEGLKKALAITFTVTGFLLIVIATLSMAKVFDEMTSFYTMIVLVIAMLVPLFVAMWKYNGFGRVRNGQDGTQLVESQGKSKLSEEKKTKIALWSIVVIPMLCIGLFLVLVLWGNKGASYEISSDCIQVKGGGYHATIPVTEIASDTILGHWPPVALRTNGMSTNKVNMGHFRLKSGENCMMFVHEDGGPVLELRTTDGGLYYLNCATEEKTMEMIKEVKATIHSRLSNSNTNTLYPQGGGTSAISQMRRRTLFVWEIAGQARNEG